MGSEGSKGGGKPAGKLVYVKKIEMRGFKSFGNSKISLALSSGLTSIIGPNGHGKSNVVDAFCFVLGWTSSKTMRAERFSDLLFNGGNGQRPAPFAEVSLHLDNRKNDLPVDSETVVISRKVDRSGKCLYRLNKKRVSRQEIVNLLSKGFLDPKGHNIVMQGEIGATIMMSSLERREVIDDIAGVAEYDVKKERALGELQKTETNLTSMKALLSEAEMRMKSLNKQKNDALLYTQLREKLDENQVILLQLKRQTCEQKLSKIESTIEDKERQIAELLKKASEVACKNLELEDEIQEIDGRIERTQGSDVITTKIKVAELHWQIRTLRDRINSEKHEYTSNEAQIAAVREDIPKVRECIRKDHQTLKKLIEKEEILVGELKKLGTDEEQSLKEIGVLSATFAKLRSEFDALVSISSTYGRHPLITTGKTIGKLCVVLDKIQDVVRAFGELLARTEHARKLQMKLQRLHTEIASRQNQLESQHVLENLRSQFVNLNDRRMKLERQIEELQRNLQEAQNSLPMASKLEHEVLESLDEIRQRKSAIQAMIARLRSANNHIQSKIQELRKHSNESQVEKAKVLTQLEAIEKELHGSKTEIEIPPATSPSEVEREVEGLKSRLQALEPINMRAVEDFRDAEKRYLALKRKHDKLEKEKQAILDFMDEVEQKKTEVFMKTYREISDNFSQIFSKLSPGGTAKLVVENPERPLERGLEIKAKPAGKELTHIDAMSGGEKALTALAFIFAIQRTRPTALYLLDEIDAHLDSENLGRVANMLQRFSKDSQIIVITLRDSMMSIADRLFGVHMDENKVSNLVSVELAEIAA